MKTCVPKSLFFAELSLHIYTPMLALPENHQDMYERHSDVRNINKQLKVIIKFTMKTI